MKKKENLHKKTCTIHLQIPMEMYLKLKSMGEKDDRSVHYIGVKLLTEAIHEK